MIINAQVNQADVPRLKVGETVEVTVEAVAGLRATGTVERISPQSLIKNNIKGYPARISLTNVDERIRPGMTANVKIPVASANNVTAVPLAAVFTEKNPDTGLMERYVYVQQGETFEKRDVKVGVSDYQCAEIQEGLKAGEVVSLELPEGRARQEGEASGRPEEERRRCRCCICKTSRPGQRHPHQQQSSLRCRDRRLPITHRKAARQASRCQAQAPPHPTLTRITST